MELDDYQKAFINTGEQINLIFAGPGTGKTTVITEYIKDLIEQGVDPDSIQVITFTKINKRDFITDFENTFPDSIIPSVSNLHAFALGQLLKSGYSNRYLEVPIRIASDFEEEIIIDDISKLNPKLGGKRRVRSYFTELSNGWSSLGDLDGNTLIPTAFIGIWQEHKRILKYVMREELIYQYMKALESNGTEIAPYNIKYLIVDEFQDLNKCDQKVIKLIQELTDCSLVCCGDDDQSIYSFRKASPEGIVNFHYDYPNSAIFKFPNCYRCGSNIVKTATSIIKGNCDREDKELTSKTGFKGFLRFFSFGGERQEAKGISKMVKLLLDDENYNYKPSDILILLNKDKNSAFSAPIKEELEASDIPVALSKEPELGDTEFGQFIIEIFCLIVNCGDSLAWRYILKLFPQIGKETFKKIYMFAKNEGVSFHKAIMSYYNREEAFFPRDFCDFIDKIEIFVGNKEEKLTVENFLEIIEMIPEDLEGKDHAITIVEEILEEGPLSFKEALKTFYNTSVNEENSTVKEGVKIMTMHSAKGLSSPVVFIPAFEDDVYGEESDFDEERRLLYVSVTRAKKVVVFTYAKRRSGSSHFSGRGSGFRTERIPSRLIEGVSGVQWIDGRDLPDIE